MREFLGRMRPPRAGWVSMGLLAVMALALAWSVQGAGWLDQLDYLAPVALWAVLFGALLGVLPISIVALLPLGAAIGAGIVLWTVGGEYHTALDQLGRLQALRTDLLNWIVVLLRTGYPEEMAPYAVGLGVLMWSTAFIGSYVVYRYHRVLDAVLLMGAALIVNMSATFTDLFGHLLLFVSAAILLWLRGALVERQVGWQRRRVNEDMEVPASIMRSGILVAGASVALAWMLTGVAVAAPLTGAWQAFDEVWTDAREQFEGVFGSLTNPDSRITGSSFGPSFAVSGSWVSRDDEVLRLASSRAVYLRAVTYNEYTGRGWRRSDGPEREVPAGEPLFTTPTSERPTVAAAVVVERITVEMLQAIGRNLFTAGSPLTVFAPSVVHEPGGYPVIGALELANALNENESYQVNVAISTATEAQLGAALTDYPEGVTELYLSTPGLTDGVRELALKVTEDASNPYEKAKALATFLSRDSSFTYDTTAAVAPIGRDMVDFFLFDPESDRTGYCQYYASAMVLMARSVGLPARVAAGFAPGERQEDGTYLVREANAHAWAEIYFPGYGWQIFEATKSIRPGFTRLSGDPADAVPPRVDPGFDPLEGEEAALNALGEGGPLASPDPVEGAIDPSGGIDEGAATRTGNAVLIALLLIGAGLAAWLRMRRLRHRWRLLPAGDRAWRQLTEATGRAGVGPRPSETIYEYAGWLEDQLPRHVVPIQTVASGKVWQSYSGRRMTVSASNRLDAAWASLRLPLVGLALRRWLRSLVRRS